MSKQSPCQGLIGRLRHKIINSLNSLEVVPPYLESTGNPESLQENLEIAQDVLKSTALDLKHSLRQMQVYLKVSEENPRPASENSLRAMMDMVSRNFRFYEAEKEISFHLELPKDDHFTFPLFEVEEIIFQLAHNAIQYSEKSSIILKIDVGDHLNIHLRDYGQGFTEAQKAYFTPDHKSKDPNLDYGQGLGLKIVRTILDKLGGTMALEDELFQGSRIRVSIPLRGLPKQEDKSQPKKAKPLSQNPKVLIVEDNLINALYLEGLLSDRPVEVETVNSGQEAIRRIQNVPPDLMILDIGLPDISGLDILDFLKKGGLQKKIEVVVVSAYSDPETQSKLSQFPVREVLSKPLMQEDLFRVINIEPGL
jgi:CheY-like chemotaxis protein